MEGGRTTYLGQMGSTPALMPFTHIKIHYSLIILSLDAMWLHLSKGQKIWMEKGFINRRCNFKIAANKTM
jgi:hypothetical protein